MTSRNRGLGDMYWWIFIVRTIFFFWSLQAAPLLDYNELAIPVPSPEDMFLPDIFLAPAPSMSGVRVVIGSS